MLAGTMTGACRHNWPVVEPALRWLETLDAPCIVASKAEQEKAYRISVPNNDLDVAAKKWKARKAFDVSELRTMKEVAPFRLPASATHLSFSWQVGQVKDAIFEGLRLAVNSIHTFGWGVDAAFARLELRSGEFGDKPANPETWLPTKSYGTPISIPVVGTLEDLQGAYTRFLGAVGPDGVNADTRPAVYRLQSYVNSSAAPDYAVFELRDVAGDDQKPLPSYLSMEIAAWMRHAVAEALRQERVPEAAINAIALGHEESSIQNSPRISYVPMPSIGHPYSDGMIRRVMIVDASGNYLRLLRRKLPSWVVTDINRIPRCSLAIPANNKVTEFYVRQALSWASVTPVILHGHNAAKGQISNSKTMKLLLQALEKGGIDISKLEDIYFQIAPFWNQTGTSRAAKVPAHLDRWPRYHVALKFRDLVSGPLLAGIGRHYGFGVFAARI